HRRPEGGRDRHPARDRHRDDPSRARPRDDRLRPHLAADGLLRAGGRGLPGALRLSYHGSAGSPAVQPPSTGSTTPVIALARGEARKTIAPAISSAWRIRPSGMRCVAACVNVSFSKNASVIGVTVKPGATALTRTPFSAQSIASERVSAATAPLLAV